ncbi:MAG TPA: type II toxin-antitoxin system VapC family toxin [Leptospiraceae bacterium]|nr:type II toxin-antitoxin system VapC family toxin [Leptospiraceae bacterium]HMW07344.1 type II toxin-antitoxin system VapC family toxin [Leptospiraceae bacterium]HMX33382.1 type II toxin-antitoxin system VapC family toxin [Leptospiraceae bacterium]HMY32948.1 type II toxin-antitoxin system VapC family toxin [Leptospiraceae bacterium]HMZ64562.1 type II toxin-antitoxin system VapC family toxin [Leptospiraceae bacterium]
MKLIDSNILIYSSLDEFTYLKEYIQSENSISEISILEVLGYHKITEEEKIYFKSAFTILTIIPLNRNIIDKAVELKQQRKLSIGDSIIAATALILSLDVLTRNEDDFSAIKDIKVFNPIK